MKIRLLKINQWLDSWDEAEWTERLPKPPAFFYVASIPITVLRRLAGVNRRDIESRRERSSGAGYQRSLEGSRARKISHYLRYGYPLSSSTKLNVKEHKTLIHPGWLPTTILVNVLKHGDVRFRKGTECSIDEDILLNISTSKEGDFLLVPDKILEENYEFSGSTLEPIEVIDGQHRLFSLDQYTDLLTSKELDTYEVPVVLFQGLPQSWQAYLFWVINVEPKRVNTSLAFDLYPELRTQSWLEHGESVKIYQDHRAQELTEWLWKHPESVWRDRIELLGQRKPGHVSNASFIRSLTNSFVRAWGKDSKIGGLFGSIDLGGKERVLPWRRAQQAAFLMIIWDRLASSIKMSNAHWVLGLKELSCVDVNSLAPNPGFEGEYSLFSTDQGVRTYHYLVNALFRFAYTPLNLEKWECRELSENPTEADISFAYDELSQCSEIIHFLDEICTTLVENMDWRVSKTPGLTAEERHQQAAYRGSSGYSLLREICLKTLIEHSKDDFLKNCAEQVQNLSK